MLSSDSQTDSLNTSPFLLMRHRFSVLAEMLLNQTNVGISTLIAYFLLLAPATDLLSASSIPDSVEDELELSTVRHRPEGLEQLEAQTRFSRKELQILYRGFKNVRPQPSSVSSAAQCKVKVPLKVTIPKDVN